jgi:DNA methylase
MVTSVPTGTTRAAVTIWPVTTSGIQHHQTALMISPRLARSVEHGRSAACVLMRAIRARIRKSRSRRSPKGRGIETEHPAVFPVAPEFVMNSYLDPADLVFEPFAGSGPSIIAGERCGRKVRAIELAPEYVDLTIARWRKLFPVAPVTLDGDGCPFDEIASKRGIELDHAA